LPTVSVWLADTAQLVLRVLTFRLVKVRIRQSQFELSFEKPRLGYSKVCQPVLSFGSWNSTEKDRNHKLCYPSPPSAGTIAVHWQPGSPITKKI
jgi:hypothetical protein